MSLAPKRNYRLLSLLAAILAVSAGNIDGALQWAPEGVKGGDGAWDLETANWLDDAQVRAFVPGSDAVFAAPAGRIDVNGLIEAGELSFSTPGYTVLLDSSQGDKLTTVSLSGASQIGFAGLIAADADNYPPLAEIRSAGLEIRPTGVERFTADMVSILGGSPVLAVLGESGRLDFAGSWFAGTGSIVSWLRLEEGGHLMFTEEADLRFIKEGYFTLQLWVTGDGTGTLELAEEFVADRTKGGTEQRGIGSMRIGAGTLISHHSQNLPLGYRPRSDGSAQTNGHLVFENQAGSRWVVRANNQVYPGAVWIFRPMELVTEADLTHVGITETSSNYTAQNGFSVINAVTVKKTGEGTLTLAGEQSYAAGAVLDIREGALSMRSDPATGRSLYGVQTGAQLTLQLQAGTRTDWDTEGALQFLFSSGSLLLRGRVEVQNGGYAQFGPGSRTEIILENGVSGPWIQSSGPVFAGGRLVVNRLPDCLPAAGSEWIVCDSSDLIGAWELVDRTGLNLEMVQDATTLKLVAGRGAMDLPGAVVLEDDFSGLSSGWKDLSTVPVWGSPPASGSAFEWVDGVLRLKRSGDRSTRGFTSYSKSDGLKTFTAIDHQFQFPVSHAGSEITVDFRLRWPDPGDASGEGGRVLILLNHDYPESGLELSPEGAVNSRFNNFSSEWWARPAYHVRLRNSTTRAGSSMLQYGGGLSELGEYERTSGWWLPGFVSGAGQLAPGDGDDFPANSWVRTKEGMARATFTSYRYRVLPDRQELWRDDNDDGFLTAGELKATMPLPLESDAPYYYYFEEFEGLRIFWNGVDNGGSADTGQMELDWVRVIVQPNVSPHADAGADSFAQVLVDGRALVQLDAAGTIDPEADELIYLWFLEGEAIATSSLPGARVQLPEGVHELELLVLDSEGNYSTDTTTVTVTPGRARPVPKTNGDQVLQASNEWFGLVDLSASGSFSPNGEIVEYRWSTGIPERVLRSGREVTATVALGIGSHTVKLTLVDEEGLSTETQLRIVIDPPDSGQQDTVIYRENFSRPGASAGELGPDVVGWKLMRFDGDPVASVQYDGNAHRSLSYDPGDTGPYQAKVNANPDGTEVDGPNTYGHMWMNQMPFLNASPGEWLLWTDEYTVNRETWELTRMTFYSRDGSPERVKVSPAVRIGEQWYIGWDLRLETRRFVGWTPYTIPLATTGWVLFEPSVFFSVKDAQPVGRLPDGDISAFGLYLFKDYAWYVNEIDNVALFAVPQRPDDPYANWLPNGFSQDFLTQAEDSGIFAPDADANNDGWINIWDFAMGRTESESAFSDPILFMGQSGPVIVIPWNEAASSLQIDVFQSRDLMSWENIRSLPDVQPLPPIKDIYPDPFGNLFRKWALPDNPDPGPLFYRLEADIPD